MDDKDQEVSLLAYMQVQARLDKAKRIVKETYGISSEPELISRVYADLIKTENKLLAKAEDETESEFLTFMDELETLMRDGIWFYAIDKKKYGELRKRYGLFGGRFGTMKAGEVP